MTQVPAGKTTGLPAAAVIAAWALALSSVVPSQTTPKSLALITSCSLLCTVRETAPVPLCRKVDQIEEISPLPSRPALLKSGAPLLPPTIVDVPTTRLAPPLQGNPPSLMTVL